MLAIIMVCVFLLCKAVNDHDSSNKDEIFPVLLCNAAFRQFMWPENEAMNVWTVSQSKGPVLVSICYAYTLIRAGGSTTATTSHGWIILGVCEVMQKVIL